MKELSVISTKRVEDRENGYVLGARCFFKLMGLVPGHRWSTLDYMAWLTDRQKEFRAKLRKTGEHPEDFWEAFNFWLENQVDGDTYVVYQPVNHEFNAPLAGLKKWGLTAMDARYEIMWSGKLEPEMTAQSIADNINDNRPVGYRGRTVAIGDVIVLSRGGKRMSWFFDNTGFVEIQNFERQKRPEIKLDKGRK